jgi:transposase InsO family protein
MNPKRTYFPPTTPQQRKLLFETWEATESVVAACATAHVGRGTFYRWKARFDAAGYPGLENYAAKGPAKGYGQTPTAVAQKVIELHAAHRDWGKQRLAHEIAKENNWVAQVSPNTVRRILTDAEVWHPKPPRPSKALRPVVRTADKPGQAVNVDLCFVPASHEAALKLPAVSGSSGHLVIERPKGDVPQYPGRIFEDTALEYEDAMRAFVAASAEPKPPAPPQADGEPISPKAEIKQFRQEEAQLRTDRRGLRQRRNQEDGAWQTLRQQHQTETKAERALSQPARRQRRPSLQAAADRWKALRQQRRQTLDQRRQADDQWRQQRLDLRARLTQLPIITAWIAILVITDNCTRQCLGLPLFVAGSHVTADMIVEALRVLLPEDLRFLISDRGIHFTAQVFQQLARDENFLHVVIARHRPQSNGIAERFVRTLKEWLATHPWTTDQELLELLEQFRLEFNDRPHQGLAIPGLSPNEFANRLRLT